MLQQDSHLGAAGGVTHGSLEHALINNGALGHTAEVGIGVDPFDILVGDDQLDRAFVGSAGKHVFFSWFETLV